MFFIFFMLLFATPAHADGAIAQGFGPNDTVVTTTAVSRTTIANARTRALSDCGRRGQQCRIIHEFKNNCVATAIFNGRQLDIGTGKTADEAAENALSICHAKGTACTSEFAACDPPDASAPTERVTAPARETAVLPRPAQPETQSTFPWLLVIILGGLGFAAYRYRNRIRALFTRDAIPAPRLAPSDADRQSAHRHVTAAWDYIQKSISATKAVNITTEGIEGIIGTLNLAAEHLVKAREFDPDTNIEVPDLGQLTQPALTGMLLFIEAGCEVQLARKSPFPYFGNRHLYRAIAALHQAIGYEAQPMYYCSLAEAYAFLGKKDQAREYVRKALDLDPNHLDSVQLETALPTIKPLHPPAPFFELKVGILIAATVLTVGSVIAGYWYLGLIPWIVLAAYYAARNELRNRLASMSWTYSHYKHKKREAKRKQFIHTLHEKRWKGGGSIWHDI